MQNLGKPEINENTQKILELKQKRTGESYISPIERSNSGSRRDNSIQNSNGLLSYRKGSAEGQTEKCPFSINDSASVATNKAKGKNGDGYNALEEILSLKEEIQQ